MRQFTATLGGKEHEITVDDNTVRIGDHVLALDARTLEPGSYSILVDGKSYVVEIDGKVPDLTVHLCGHTVTLNLLDARRKMLAQAAARTAGAVDAGPTVVRSPMPGKVVKVLIKEGDAVKAGAGVMVVEAMKMENELRAPRDGKIVKVLVREGQAVESGEELAQIE
jgi:biotin carboxyl carrier protein